MSTNTHERKNKSQGDKKNGETGQLAIPSLGQHLAQGNPYSKNGFIGSGIL